MDFLVAFSNFAGDVANFDQYYFNSSVNNTMPCSSPLPLLPSNNTSSVVKGLCVGQAVVALYSTLSSVLWTTSLAVYLYLLIVHYRSKACLTTVYAVLCTLLRLSAAYNLRGHGRRTVLVSLHSTHLKLVWSHQFRAPYRDSRLALCSHVVRLWIYLTMFSVTLLFIGIRLYLADQVGNQMCQFLI